MAKVKHGQYEMQACDGDIQNNPARTAAGVVSQWSQLFDEALKIIFEKVKIYTHNQLVLDRKSFGGLFFATKLAPVSLFVSNESKPRMTGKHPVEWKLRSTGGHGGESTNWQLMIDLDDIPPGVKVNGPDRPHIGYLLTGKGKWTMRVDGHIFIEHVIASRNAIGEEQTIAAKLFETPLGSIN